jgi:hypothetical protein
MLQHLLWSWETEFDKGRKGLCNNLLASNPQSKATENNVGAECHKWQVKVWSIYVMARGLIFQAPSYLLWYSGPRALWLSRHEHVMPKHGHLANKYISDLWDSTSWTKKCGDNK